MMAKRIFANVTLQVLSVQTTIPNRRSARHLLVAQQRVVASSAAEHRLEARRLAGSERTTTRLLDLAVVPALVQAFSEAQASLPLAVALPRPPMEVCSVVEAPADSAPTPPQVGLAVGRLVGLVRQQQMHPTTEPQAHYSRPIPRRMEHPRRSTTRPSPSSSRTQTTPLKS